MKRSTHRILTTHVGSLARPDSLIPILRAKERGQPYDAADFARLAREAVADAVRKQVEAGIDVVADGEQGRASFFGYVVERFNGFERKPARPGEEGTPRATGREYLAFPDYYAWSERIAEWAGGRGGDRSHGVDTCTGPISYKGLAAVQTEIENLKAALRGLPHEEVFMPAIAPSYIAATLPNEYYRTESEYEQAIADALREEYKAIVDAGFILQIDDPRIVTQFDSFDPEPTAEEYRRFAELGVEALNHALAGIPEDRVRYHVCWGSWHGPHTTDIPFRDIAAVILKVRAQAFCIESANPRHAHEYHYWEDHELPDGKIIIPGVIAHTTRCVEHPELVADRIVAFAGLVGRENVIAGVDCGFAQSYDVQRVHPTIMWEKFRVLAEGARLATKRLWGSTTSRLE